MRDIKDMTVDEMRQEMLGYPYNRESGYMFVSYSHKDSDKVYPLVLSWMRAGYNIYIDMDFSRHGSDSNWVEQMRKAVANRFCRLVVCFGSVHYTYSYAALLELLTIRGKKVNDLRGKIPVDYYVMGEIPMGNDDIQEKYRLIYKEYFNELRNSMGAAFLGQNAKERDAMHRGLEYWLKQDNCPLAGDTAEEWMENLEDAYEQGYLNFFPVVAGLVKKWIVSQGLNTNCYSLDTELRIQEERFISQRVEKLEARLKVHPESDELLRELRSCYGPEAEFRDGQEEAIRGILAGKRTLVVQKTGWGKSLVYFLATKMLRKRSDAVTLIISPLLALMNNQIESAGRLGLQVKTVNSENTEEWEEIFQAFREHTLDALIISPERLANEQFRQMLAVRTGSDIGLFVVDEAHCISDWGHDFRPDYRRIVNIIHMLPSNIPVLATTATANNRVVNDIKTQLGDDLLISRGSLMRESLALQVIKLGGKEARLAWIAEHIDSIPGTGIIYCRTVNDCRLVHGWLQAEGIPSECYYAGVDRKEGKDKQEIIDSFMKNEIKALVATVAFGMGFDKPDIGFVIHFQRPGNIVSYYQQIGRAGRALDQAYAILLCGDEDDSITNYFINTAFPTEDQMNDIINAVIDHPGLRARELERYVNMKASQIQKCINYLEVNGDIYREGNQYYKSLRAWQPDMERCAEITRIRKAEMRQMNDFANLSGCYMEYIARFLDDAQADRCGKCANCLREPLFSEEVSEFKVAEAQRFICSSFNVIEPRKKWPMGVRVDDRNAIEETNQCGAGRVLSNYADAGWGRLVREGKYRQGFFGTELVDASCALLRDFVRENEITWVTNISSIRRPDLVRDFAKALAEKLGLEYADVIRKTVDARCQKELNTSILQYENAAGSFEVEHALAGNVLLVDDMVDSRWTFTVCGYKLRKKGSGKVFPFALANSADRNGDE